MLANGNSSQFWPDSLAWQIGSESFQDSTVAVEATARRLRDLFEQRSFALRNARRTNLLFGLARLHLNNLDDATIYHQILRRRAEAAGGAPPAPQRTNRDRARDPVTGRRISSLR